MRMLEVTKIFNKPVAIFVLATLGGFFLSQPVSAASDISVSNSGKVSFGKVQPTSSGTLATGQDTLSIATDCEAGVNVYATSTNGGSTSLVNLAANSNNTIATSSNTISSPSSLENNTWGLNIVNNNTFYGLPEYSASGLPTVIYSGTNTELPIYYGAKVTNSLAPGTYTGEVLYTVTVNNSCLDYTVKFDKNTNDASGDMSDQSILPTGGTLSENSFTYSGYAFLGWSLDPAGKTGTATNGIGTAEDVDFADKASFPGSNEGILPGSETTLYAIWEVKPPEYMQNWLGCAKMQANEIATLIDSRDNHEYKVEKLPDGNCWMIQNLTLSADDMVTENKALTSADTNIDNGTTYYLPKRGYQGSITSSSTPTSTSTVNFSTSSDSQGRIGYRAKGTTDNDTGNQVPEDTAYYSFYTATLGFSYYNDGKSSGSSPRDICPKGWRLPKVSDNGTSITAASSEFANLARSYNSSASWTDVNTSYDYYTSDSTIRQNMIKGDASSLDPELDTNGSAGFTYAGYYYSTTLHNVGTSGDYWSSSVYNTGRSYLLFFNTSNVYPQNYNYKDYGYAVRCIDQNSNVSGYMQDFDTNTELLDANESVKLMDKRDGKVYTVKRLPDGKVWMMQNLTINGVELTPKDTNIADGNTYYLPKNGGAGSLTSSSTKNATTGYNFASGSDNQAMFKFRSKNTSYTNDSDTGYYNFYTATLGYSYTNDGKTSGTSPQDICPKGWRMPRTTDSGTNVTAIDTTNDFTYLARTYSTSNWSGSSTGTGGYNYYSTNSTLMNSMYKSAASPLATATANNYAGFSYAGYWEGTNSSASDVGSRGRYWSASIYDTSYVHGLFFDSSYVYPQSNFYKYRGLAVRCIAKPSYTINYDANGGTGEMSPSKGYIGGSTLSNNTFTKDGYYFLGWSTDPSATSPTYTDGATISTDLTSAGGSITLYAVWRIEDPSIMQTSNVCQYIPEGQTVNLTDSRDGQPYPVYHIPSDTVYPGTSTVANVAGKCFMAKDLNLGAVASVEGSDSTIVANGAMTLSPFDSNFTTPTGSGESITVPTSSVGITNGTGSWGSNESYYNTYGSKRYTTSGTGDYAGRGYYSWGAAMTVCPKGWRLPAQDEYNNNDSSWNASTTGISKLVNNTLSTAQVSPWSLNLGGYYGGSFDRATSRGLYWSSTQYSSTGSYNLFLYSSSGLERGGNSKYLGFAVRCIAD